MDLPKVTSPTVDTTRVASVTPVAPIKAPVTTKETAKTAEVAEKQAVRESVSEAAEDMIQSSIEQANEVLSQYDRRIDRAVHEKTKTMIYKIVDTSKENEEVVREFPAREIQDMIARMWELAGFNVDKKA